MVEPQWDAFGGRAGLVRRCTPVPTDAGFPRLHFIETQPAKVSVFQDNDIVGGTGGVGTTEAEAVACAVGEAVERYCCSHYTDRDFVYAAKTELGDEALGMDRFALFSGAQYQHPQFPFAQWRADRPIRWVAGRCLMTGERRYVPAALVYVPYVPQDENDLVSLAVSTGQASHFDRTRALVTGLYEVIERDAFVITWMRGMRVPRVDFRADPGHEAFFQRHLANCGLEFHLFDITLDIGVPSFLCIAEGTRQGRTVFGCGAATRLSERAAIRKALLESAHTFLYAMNLLKEDPDWRPADDFSNVVRFRDHVRLFSEPTARDHLSFLLDTPRRRVPDAAPDPTATPEAALQICLERVASVGLEAVELDITTPEIAAAGLHVCKVFLPGSVPLTSTLPAVGSPRLRSVPKILGYGDEVGDHLNRVPHPFP